MAKSVLVSIQFYFCACLLLSMNSLHQEYGSTSVCVSLCVVLHGLYVVYIFLLKTLLSCCPTCFSKSIVRLESCFFLCAISVFFVLFFLELINQIQCCCIPDFCQPCGNSKAEWCGHPSSCCCGGCFIQRAAGRGVIVYQRSYPYNGKSHIPYNSEEVKNTIPLTEDPHQEPVNYI